MLIISCVCFFAVILLMWMPYSSTTILAVRQPQHTLLSSNMEILYKFSV